MENQNTPQRRTNGGSHIAPSKKKKKSKPRKGLVALIIVIAALLILAVTAFAVVNSFLNKLNYDTETTVQPSATMSPTPAPTPEPTAEPEEEEVLEDSPEEEIKSLEDYLLENLEAEAEDLDFDDSDVYNLLLIGSDRRSASENGRTDSMILVSINRDTKQIVMCSFMRDIYCSIPGYCSHRLNSAYSWGGVSLLFDTMEANFKIPIDEYVEVDFDSFETVIDMVGGVDITLNSSEANYMNTNGRSSGTVYAGENHLDGEQALNYCRIRYIGNGDYERTERQRRVLADVFEKAKNLSLTELVDLVNEVLPAVTTNLSKGEVWYLLAHSAEFLKYDLVGCRVPYDGSYRDMVVSGMAVLGIDFDANRNYWYDAAYNGSLG